MVKAMHQFVNLGFMSKNYFVFAMLRFGSFNCLSDFIICVFGLNCGDNNVKILSLPGFCVANPFTTLILYYSIKIHIL